MAQNFAAGCVRWIPELQEYCFTSEYIKEIKTERWMPSVVLDLVMKKNSLLRKRIWQVPHHSFRLKEAHQKFVC